MNTALLVALVVFVPASVMLAGSLVLLSRGKTIWSLLQVVGAACLMIVGLCHVCEALHLFPWMHWGLKHSVGHYLDLWSAALGVTLFPVGYLFDALTKR
jgi:hypothetical protein